MSIVLIDSAGMSNNGSHVVVDSTGADFLVLVAMGDAGQALTVDEDVNGVSNPNTWVALPQQVNTTRGVRILYTVPVRTGSSHQVAAVSSHLCQGLMAFSGVKQTSPFDQQTSGTDLTPGPLTPSENGCLLIAGINQDNGDLKTAISDGFTYEGTGLPSGSATGGAMAYKVQTAAAEANPAWSGGSGSGTVAAVLASFFAADGGLTVGDGVQIFINEVEINPILESINLQMVASGIDTLAFDVDFENASDVYEVDDRVVMFVNGERVFSGVITQAPLSGFGGPNLDLVVAQYSAASADLLLSYQYLTLALDPDSTLREWAEAIVPYFEDCGITLDASQVDGPAIPEVSFVRTRADEILNTLCDMADGYVWEVTASNKLRLYLPGTDDAPSDLTDSGDVYLDGELVQVGDVEIQPTKDDTYANKVTVVVTGAGPATSTEEFGPTDYTTEGGYRYFTAKYPASVNINDAWPNELLFDGVNQGPVGRVVDDPTPSDVPTDAWDWEMREAPLPARLRYRIASGAAFPTTETISVTYAIAYPFAVSADNLGSPPSICPREAIVEVAQAMTIEAAEAYAQSLLTKKSTVTRKAVFSSHVPGWRPGQGLTITLAARNVDADFVIGDVSMAPETNSPPGVDIVPRYTITALEGDKVQGNWRDTPKAWMKGGTSFGGGVARTGSGGSASAATASGIFRVLTADPSSPSDDTFWMVRDGASPQSIALRARIDGVTVTVAEITA